MFSLATYKMSHFFIFITSFVLLLTTQATAITYTVTNNASNTRGGSRFKNEVGSSYARRTLSSATDFIWQTLQLTNPADRNNTIHRVNLKLETGMSGISDESNNQIRLSADYLQSYSGDIKTEVTGILFYEMTHVWQWTSNGLANEGLVEGIADFVRLKAGYVGSKWGKPGHGDRWDEGFDVTARFLDYCDSLRKGFVAKLNKKMKDGYSDAYFIDLLGKSVDQLWSDYKAKYTN